jgi:hypothetical protein
MTPSSDTDELVKSSRVNMFKTPPIDETKSKIKENSKAKKANTPDDGEVEEEEVLKPADQKILLEKLNSIVDLTPARQLTPPPHPSPPPPVNAEPVKIS